MISMEKQIEEMVVLMCGERKKHKSCKGCKSGNLNANAYCRIEHYAEALYNAGYRKASDVVKEIFEEIERIAMSKIDGDLSIAVLNDTYYIEAIDELKKKYESEGQE